jgi:hypothetical protein
MLTIDAIINISRYREVYSGKSGSINLINMSVLNFKTIDAKSAEHITLDFVWTIGSQLHNGQIGILIPMPIINNQNIFTFFTPIL